jgi:predicted PurR-regulated permease PerM/GNAT superfamily N-acetyltransferase
MDKPVAKWDATTKRIVTLVILLLLALIVSRFRAVLPPLVLAGLLAFILDPVVDFLEQRARLPRTAAAAIVLVVAILVLLAAPVVAVPPLVRAVRSLNLDFARIAVSLERLLAQPITVLQWQIDLRTVYQQFQQSVREFLSTVAAGTVNVVFGFASTLFWAIFILLSTFYMVRDADRMISWLDNLIPPTLRDDAIRLRLRVTRVWSAFLRGQLVMAFLMATITTVADTIIGLPNALALGLLAGVMEFIPSIGPVVAAVPAILVALFQGSTWLPLTPFWFAVLVLGVYLVIQQIEGNILLPRVMGQSLNLHPLVVLVAVILGGNLAGVLGMLLAAPTVATLGILGRYVYCRLTDQDPFTEPSRRRRAHPDLFRQLWNGLRGLLVRRQAQARPARPEDRAAMEAICAQVWDGEDYIPEVWEDWLADPYGEFSVLEVRGRVVALGKLTRLADDEWWLEGLRVDPAYRHLGLARKLQAHQLRQAERLGQGWLRLATASYNKAVHHLATRDHFHHVAEFLYCAGDPLPRPCGLQPLVADDLEAAWNLLADSPARQASAGLYETCWRWQRLTRERLAAHLTAGEVWGVKQEGRLAAVALVPLNQRGERLLVSLVDGEPAAVQTLVTELRALAHDRGLIGLRHRPPAYPPLLDTLHAAGLVNDWEHSLWIFERRLGTRE